MDLKCEFELLDNPSNVYYSGQILNGLVTLTASKPTYIRAFYVEIEGKGYCKSDKNITTKDYFRKKIYFFGAENGKTLVNPGEYEETFQCFLPPNLPTSLESQDAYNRYSATIVLDERFLQCHVLKKEIILFRPLDLNDYLNLLEPIQKTIEKTFYLGYCLTCFESPLTITARIPVGGYIPGQTIPLKFTADNQSILDVLKFKAQLIKRNNFMGRIVIEIKAEEIKGSCKRDETRAYEVNLPVGLLPPTDCDDSNLCKVQYFVRIIAVLPGLRSNVKLYLPIVIGVRPFSADGTDEDTTMAQFSAVNLPPESIVVEQNNCSCCS